MRSLPLTLLLLATLIAPALAAPPDYSRYTALDALSLGADGTAEVLLSPRLMLWPQLERKPDQVILHVPGDEPRTIYSCEPLYRIEAVFGIAEGDWAVFAEAPEGGAGISAGPMRLIAYFLPRGQVYKWEVDPGLDRRYSYAPRIFGFPALSGDRFYWLILPPGGTPNFGTATLTRNLAQLSVDNDRLVAKTLDPKSFQGTSTLGYSFYGLGKDAGGLPTLTLQEERGFPSGDGNRFDAVKIYWHPDYTVLVTDPVDADPAVNIAPEGGGAGKSLSARLLAFEDGRALLLSRDTLSVAVLGRTGEPGAHQVEAKEEWSLLLGQASKLGTAVWASKGLLMGDICVIELQVQLPGQDYAMGRLGTPVLAVWDMATNALIYELAGQGQKR